MSYKKLTPAQKLIQSAINYKALSEAMSDPKKRKEIEKILNKVR